MAATQRDCNLVQWFRRPRIPASVSFMAHLASLRDMVSCRVSGFSLPISQKKSSISNSKFAGKANHLYINGCLVISNHFLYIYIKNWFIIQLKHPFVNGYKWLFGVPGQKKNTRGSVTQHPTLLSEEIVSQSLRYLCLPHSYWTSVQSAGFWSLAAMMMMMMMMLMMMTKTTTKS